MRTSIVVAALLHHALSFMAPPVRVAPSLRVTSATRAATDDDATAAAADDAVAAVELSLIHISEPTRQAEISYAVFCLKK